MSHTDDHLAHLGITLPEVSAPMANYVPAVRAGDLVFLSGQGPRRPDGTFVTGKLGAEIDVEEGYAAARLVGLGLLAALKAEVGDLDHVRIVKVLGMVNCTPEFGQQPQVINGCSDLLVEVLGDRGKHARSAVGMPALPVNIAVEIELVAQVLG